MHMYWLGATSIVGILSGALCRYPRGYRTGEFRVNFWISRKITARPINRAPLGHTRFYCQGALFPWPDKTRNQFPIQFFIFSSRHNSKWFGRYINHISDHAFTLKQNMNRPLIPDSYPFSLPNSILWFLIFWTQTELTLRMCGIPDEVAREANWIFIRSRFNRNSSTNSTESGFWLAERATRLSIVADRYRSSHTDQSKWGIVDLARMRAYQYAHPQLHSKWRCTSMKQFRRRL